MRTIYKYPLRVEDSQTLWLPSSAKPLSVQLQHGQICLWAEVNTGVGGQKKVVISIVGTSHLIPPGAVHYLGTVQQDGFVWHVYASTAMGERG